ncbi:hypothetical protein CONLIGDRAFT_629525 [Coniochaeta ligniaria NRRL 30616]|uniref:Uncharacterized protein n=1 Tax=Coniochaeta ligniaria NRRL 30616 TaxID=1408157 RepID=A0A1J7JET4_9PEZI|nr:hypothetical protein CONLIGDRAFT_629525 [Coniochaeta ligniaria NRRL 30616]
MDTSAVPAIADTTKTLVRHVHAILARHVVANAASWTPRTKPDQDQLPAVHVTSVIKPDQLGK